MKSQRRSRVGWVISNRADKTAVVGVEITRRHPVYKKTVRQISKYHVHDERGMAAPGDTVLIVECRPISKEKRWRLAGILRRNITEELSDRVDIGGEG